MLWDGSVLVQRWIADGYRLIARAYACFMTSRKVSSPATTRCEDVNTGLAGRSKREGAGRCSDVGQLMLLGRYDATNRLDRTQARSLPLPFAPLQILL